MKNLSFAQQGASFLRYLSLALSLIIIGWVSPLHSQYPNSNFELVESIPIETNLDNPDIRNTPSVWLEIINGARSTLDIEHFYFSNEKNTTLDTVVTALAQAIKRGVRVRILLDARMSRTYPQSVAQLQQIGATVKTTAVFNRLGGVQHAKFMVIDSSAIFLGSQNFDWRALSHIHELGFYIKHHQLATDFLKIYEQDWNQSQPGEPATQPSTRQNYYSIKNEDGTVINFYPTANPLNYVPDGFQWDEIALLKLIAAARKSIYVQLLSYSTEDRNGAVYVKLDNALRAAAARGVDIRLLISDWATDDHELPGLKDLARIANISVRLSTIPEWSQGYIPYARVEHCKYCVVDDSLSWLGTSNWSKSYFYTSRNLGLVVGNPAINARLRAIFLKSWDSPYAWQLKPEQHYPVKFHGEIQTK